MANTLKFGNGEWATKKGSTLAYNDENGNFKPLPFTFDRSTSATRVNKEGLIEVVSNNEPRIDFLNDSKGALLLEPNRSNLILSSEDISGTGWGRTGWTLTSGFISPDGTNNAYSILRTTGASFATTLSLSANTTYTYSVYIKNVDATNIQLRVQNSAGNSSGTESNCIVFQVTDQTNTDDFVRITHTFNTGDAGSYGIFLGYYSAGEYIAWGAQLEQGSYATSIIPTQGSIGTRVQEDSVTQILTNSVVGQTQGTIFYDINMDNINSNSQYVGVVSDGTSSNRIQFLNNSSQQWQLFISASTISNNISLTTSTSGVGRYKIAIAYESGNVAYYINGVQKGTSSETFTFSNLLHFDLGQRYDDNFFLDNSINEAKLYNTRLTDQELINLTTI